MIKRSAFIFVSLLASLHAQAVESLSYSGRLVNADGSPVSGPVKLEFKLGYTTTPFSAICTKEIDSVPLTKGVFHLKLDFDPVSDCGSLSMTNILSSVPAGESIALQVRDVTNSKTYSLQAIHSIPTSIMASMAKTLHSMGASSGQYLMWDGTKWIPSAITGATGGTVTQVQTGTGLSGGPITSTGTISIANSGVGTLQLADGSVTDSKVASGITRSKLANGTASYVLVNSPAGVMSEVASISVAQGGTGASTVAGAWTNLGLGSSAGYNVLSCLPGEVSKFVLPGGWTCVTDTNNDATKLPLAGGTMTGAINMNSLAIINLANPVDPADAANKAYVDAQIGDVSESQWTTAGSNIHFNTGNVGIGDATPDNKLTIRGTHSTASASAYNGLLLIHDETNSVAPHLGASVSYDGGNQHAWFQVSSSSGAFPLALQPAGGQVGIGITNPSSLLHVNGDAALNGKLRLKSDNVNFVELKAPASLAGTIVFHLPGTLGTSGQALISDGSGNLSWASVATSSSSLSGEVTGTMTSTTIANNTITSAKIVDGTIVDADISATANIAQSKIAGLVTALAGKENSVAAGTTAQYLRGDKTWQTLNTAAVPEQTNLYFTEPRVLATTLSGYSTSSGSVSAADSVLSAIGKLAGNQGLFVMKSGDSMSGALQMGGNIISGVGSPTANDHAATKYYVDSLIGSTGQWTKSGTTISYTAGKVGVGTSSPLHDFSVNGVMSVRTGMGAAPTDGGKILLGLNQDNSSFFMGSISAYNDFTDGAGAIGGLAFGTKDSLAASTPSERMRITADGFVGIGTVAPTERLDVNGRISVGPNSAWNQRLILGIDSPLANVFSASVGATDGNLHLEAKNGNSVYINHYSNGGGHTLINTGQATGNVGIGLVSPVAKFQIAAQKTMTYPSSGVATGSIHLSPTVATNNDSMAITFGGIGGGNLQANQAHAGIYVQSSDLYGTKMFFGTTNVYANGSQTRMMIDQLGNVGIGTITPSAKLDVLGDVRASGFNASSDIRLKTNLSKSKGVKTVQKLSGYRFEWKESGRPEYGVMAQEVEKVMPELVVTDANSGFKSVKYNGLIAPLIEAVKEIYAEMTGQNKKISEQERKIATLEKRNKELEDRLLKIEKSLAEKPAKK